MTTPAFDAEFTEVRKRNRLLTYEEKLKLWSLCERDWGNGKERMPYVPFEKAVQIHKSKARILTIAAGNRFAKSLIASMEAVVAMTQPGTKIWILAQTLSICENEWEYIVDCLTKTDLFYEYIEPEIKRQMKKRGKTGSTSRYIKVKNNEPKAIKIDWPDAPASVIEMKSYGHGNWNKLEGSKLSMMIFAEGSRVPIDLWERHLKKRLSDLSGRVIIPSTPKGKDEFLYPAFKKGQSSEMVVDINWKDHEVHRNYVPVKKGAYHVDNAESYMESYETFQFAGYDNPFYNQADYDADVDLLFAGELDENTFKERNFGCFVSLAGAFYLGMPWDNCLRENIEIPEDATHYVTLDPGRASRAAVYWIAVCPPDDFGVEQWLIYDEIYQKGYWSEKLAGEILERNRYPIERYIADRVITRDTNHSERNVEMQLRDAGLNPISVPWKMPKHTIDRLNHWKPWLRKGQMLIDAKNCPNLVDELQNLEYKPKEYRNGRSEQTEEVSGADHAIDAITYAVYCRLRHIKNEAPPVIQERHKPAEHNSFRKMVERDNRRRTSRGLINLIGTF